MPEEKVTRTPALCSLCGAVRAQINREGTKYGACSLVGCKDPLFDYRQEQLPPAADAGPRQPEPQISELLGKYLQRARQLETMIARLRGLIYRWYESKTLSDTLLSESAHLMPELAKAEASRLLGGKS